MTDNPFATIYPLVFLTKLIPVPRSDGNDLQDAHDTAMWHDAFTQMEMYLRAVCEGYVDPDSTATLNGCAADLADDVPVGCTFLDHGLYDFTFENLCFASFHGRWITCLPSAATTMTGASDTRSDRPQGFGPLPNVRLSAEVWNQFSEAWNRLTHVRLTLPTKLESRWRGYTGERLLLAGADGSATCGPDDCGASGKFAVSCTAPPATTPAPAFPWSAWSDAGVGAVLSATTSAQLGNDCLDWYWALGTDRRVEQYRFTLDNPVMMHAIPPAWQDMVDIGANLAGLFCITSAQAHQVANPSTTHPCGTGVMGCGFNQVNRWEAHCGWLSAGILDAGPTAPPSWFYIGKRAVGGGYTIDCGGGSSTSIWAHTLSSRESVVIVPLA